MAWLVVFSDGGDAWWSDPAPVQSGSVVEWATFVATMGAVIAASIFAIEANKFARKAADAAADANTITQQLLNLEKDREAEAARLKELERQRLERAQADGVSAWIEAVDGQWVVTVDNSSSGAVFGLRTKLVGPRVMGGIPPRNIVFVHFGVLRPGTRSKPFSIEVPLPLGPMYQERKVFVQSRNALGRSHPTLEPESPEMYRVVLEFQDAGERAWERDAEGRLKLLRRPESD